MIPSLLQKTLGFQKPIQSICGRWSWLSLLWTYWGQNLGTNVYFTTCSRAELSGGNCGSPWLVWKNRHQAQGTNDYSTTKAMVSLSLKTSAEDSSLGLSPSFMAWSKHLRTTMNTAFKLRGLFSNYWIQLPRVERTNGEYFFFLFKKALRKFILLEQFKYHAIEIK